MKSADSRPPVVGERTRCRTSFPADHGEQPGGTGPAGTAGVYRSLSLLVPNAAVRSASRAVWQFRSGELGLCTPEVVPTRDSCVRENPAFGHIDGRTRQMRIHEVGSKGCAFAVLPELHAPYIHRMVRGRHSRQSGNCTATGMSRRFRSLRMSVASSIGSKSSGRISGCRSGSFSVSFVR